MAAPAITVRDTTVQAITVEPDITVEQDIIIEPDMVTDTVRQYAVISSSRADTGISVVDTATFAGIGIRTAGIGILVVTGMAAAISVEDIAAADTVISVVATEAVIKAVTEAATEEGTAIDSASAHVLSMNGNVPG